MHRSAVVDALISRRRRKSLRISPPLALKPAFQGTSSQIPIQVPAPRMDTQTHAPHLKEPGQTLDAQGLKPTGSVHWNQVQTVLLDQAIRRNEGQLADMGPFCA